MRKSKTDHNVHAIHVQHVNSRPMTFVSTTGHPFSVEFLISSSKNKL